MLSAMQRKTVRHETVVSAAINAVMTGLVTYFLFNETDDLILTHTHDMTVSLFITAFIVGVMSTFPTTLITRKKLRSGKIEVSRQVHGFIGKVPLPANALLRGLTVGAGSSLVIGSLAYFLLHLALPEAVNLTVLVAGKFLFAAAIALMITPQVVLLTIAEKSACGIK